MSVYICLFRMPALFLKVFSTWETTNSNNHELPSLFLPPSRAHSLKHRPPAGGQQECFPSPFQPLSAIVHAPSTGGRGDGTHSESRWGTQPALSMGHRRREPTHTWKRLLLSIF